MTKKHKYSAKRAHRGGRWFDSQAEGHLFDWLQLQQKNGEISDLKCQHTVDLVAGIRLRVDFSFTRSGQTVYCEMKGFETPEWRLKYKLWKAGFGPGHMEIYKYKTGKGLVLHETLRPELGEHWKGS